MLRPARHTRSLTRIGRLFFLYVGVAAIISVVAPLTQAALNPARDFGPRAVSWFLGWGDIAIPGPRGGFFTVYILAPISGAIIGAGVYKAPSSLLPAVSKNGD